MGQLHSRIGDQRVDRSGPGEGHCWSCGKELRWGARKRQQQTELRKGHRSCSPWERVQQMHANAAPDRGCGLVGIQLVRHPALVPHCAYSLALWGHVKAVRTVRTVRMAAGELRLRSIFPPLPPFPSYRPYRHIEKTCPITTMTESGWTGGCGRRGSTRRAHSRPRRSRAGRWK